MPAKKSNKAQGNPMISLPAAMDPPLVSAVREMLELQMNRAQATGSHKEITVRVKIWGDKHMDIGACDTFTAVVEDLGTNRLNLIPAVALHASLDRIIDHYYQPFTDENGVVTLVKTPIPISRIITWTGTSASLVLRGHPAPENGGISSNLSHFLDSVQESTSLKRKASDDHEEKPSSHQDGQAAKRHAAAGGGRCMIKKLGDFRKLAVEIRMSGKDTASAAFTKVQYKAMLDAIEAVQLPHGTSLFLTHKPGPTFASSIKQGLKQVCDAIGDAWLSDVSLDEVACSAAAKAPSTYLAVLGAKDRRGSS